MTGAALLILTSRAFCFSGNVEDISGRKYFPTVKDALQEAKESIFMVMYVARVNPHDKNSRVYQLIQELINAHERGVKVRVILDQNVGLPQERDGDEWAIEGKNAWTFKMAKEAGIDVAYDDPVKQAHAKAIVIDSEYVILGSANWTEAALNQNFETNALIKSKELAAEFLKSFEEIEVVERAGAETDVLKPPVFVSWEFLSNAKLAGNIVTRHDERSLDLYLLLLRDFDNNPEGIIELDYKKTAVSLGIHDKMSREAYRRQIIKTARKLEKRYGLIKFEPAHGKAATITLLSYDEPQKPYSLPKSRYFQVPASYWEYGWDRKLSMRAKFCYLVNLAYVRISNAKPWWHASRETLSESLNVSPWLISKGMQELTQLNIIDVEYPPLDVENMEDRLAKSYKVRGLYDPAWLEAEWDRLETLYGKAPLRKARKYARIIYEDNDTQIIEDIILKMSTYGEGRVAKAFSKISKKAPDNPKRSYKYVVGILQSEANEAQ